MQSGSDLALWALNEPEQNPEDYTKQKAEELDCPTEDSQEMVDCLRTKSTYELRTAEWNCTVS